MPAAEVSFCTLAGVPLHYDRLPAPNNYGSKGVAKSFGGRKVLRDTLESCLSDLFGRWGRGTPTIILTAGTIGDGKNAHGQGYAFDLDGFYWGNAKFMMKSYPQDRPFYVGINAHLFLYFSQVLSYHYPGHADHFHVDFNFSFKFRPESNAQTFFLQSALRHLFDQDIGKTGAEKDGVDGIYGGATKSAATAVVKQLGLAGQGGLGTPAVWKTFLKACRDLAFP